MFWYEVLNEDGLALWLKTWKLRSCHTIWLTIEIIIKTKVVAIATPVKKTCQGFKFLISFSKSDRFLMPRNDDRTAFILLIISAIYIRLFHWPKSKTNFRRMENNLFFAKRKCFLLELIGVFSPIKLLHIECEIALIRWWGLHRNYYSSFLHSIVNAHFVGKVIFIRKKTGEPRKAHQ